MINAHLEVSCKYHANCSISWGRDGSGDNVGAFPFGAPPAPRARERRARAARWSYYENVCTLGYSMAWWGWARWRREIDWAAMQGVNLPLAFVGQEAVLDDVFRDPFSDMFDIVRIPTTPSQRPSSPLAPSL